MVNTGDKVPGELYDDLYSWWSCKQSFTELLVIVQKSLAEAFERGKCAPGQGVKNNPYVEA